MFIFLRVFLCISHADVGFPFLCGEISFLGCEIYFFAILWFFGLVGVFVDFRGYFFAF